MPTPSADQIKNTGEYLELILGGGVSSFLVLGFLYHKFYLLEKFKEVTKPFEGLRGKFKEEKDYTKRKLQIFEDYVAKDRQAFIEFSSDYKEYKSHTDEAIRRIDLSESRVDDFIVEAKSGMEGLRIRLSDLKTGYGIQEDRTRDLEVKERRHYEGIKDMESDNRVMQKDIEHIKDDLSELKSAVNEMTKAIKGLSDSILHLNISKN